MISSQLQEQIAQATDDYVQLMVGCQGRLYAFLLTLVGDPEQVREVLQETNLVLWRKSDQFQPGTNFMAWAFKIARFQLMAHRQRIGRDRHVFDDEVLGELADEFDQLSEGQEDRMDALPHCMSELPEEGRRLLNCRYAEGISVKQLAEQRGQSANRLAVRLHRLRVVLMRCIERRSRGEPA